MTLQGSRRSDCSARGNVNGRYVCSLSSSDRYVQEAPTYTYPKASAVLRLQCLGSAHQPPAGDHTPKQRCESKSTTSTSIRSAHSAAQAPLGYPASPPPPAMPGPSASQLGALSNARSQIVSSQPPDCVTGVCRSGQKWTRADPICAIASAQCMQGALRGLPKKIFAHCKKWLNITAELHHLAAFKQCAARESAF